MPAFRLEEGSKKCLSHWSHKDFKDSLFPKHRTGLTNNCQTNNFLRKCQWFRFFFLFFSFTLVCHKSFEIMHSKVNDFSFSRMQMWPSFFLPFWISFLASFPILSDDHSRLEPIFQQILLQNHRFLSWFPSTSGLASQKHTRKLEKNGKWISFCKGQHFLKNSDSALWKLKSQNFSHYPSVAQEQWQKIPLEESFNSFHHQKRKGTHFHSFSSTDTCLVF